MTHHFSPCSIRANRKIYIFMEFANGGDITGYLTKNGPIPEALTCYWFTQTCKAISYIHETLHIAHRLVPVHLNAFPILTLL